MVLIGFILLISLITLYIGILGVVITSALTIWGKIAVISLVTFVYAGIIAVYNEKYGESN